MKPTKQPTLLPTVPFSSRWDTIVSTYKSSLIRSTAVYHVIYFDLSWSGKQFSGSCPEWTVLLSDTLATASISYTPIALTISGLTANGLLELNDRTENATAIKSRMKTSKCSTAQSVASIVSALRNVFSSSNLAFPYQASFSCQETTWSVVKCAADSLPILCTQCANYCTKTEEENLSLTQVVSCSDPSQSSIGQLYTLFVEYSQLSPPPSILSLNTISSSRNIQVSTELSGSGALVCAAYLRSVGYTPPSSDALLSQGFPIAGAQIGTSYMATYEISNLIPASSYLVYCATKSLMLPTLSSDMSRVAVTTSCCRNIKIKLLKLTFTDQNDSPFALSIDIGFVPQDTLVVSLVVIDLANSSSFVSRPMFAPSSFTFTSSSSIVIAQSTYLRNVASTYRLQASVGGASRGDYAITFPAGDTFSVKNSEIEPSPPLLQTAIFSNDGGRVILTFASGTNKGGSSNVIKCSPLLSSQAIDQSTRCVWTSLSTVEIYSTGDLGIQVGQVITLAAGFLKSACTSIVDPTCKSWKTNTLQRVNVSAPSVVLKPTIVVSIPSQLGPCDNLIIDLTASTGNGGRSWRSFSLFTEGNSPNMTDLQNFLMKVNSISSPVVVPFQLLNSGYAYNLRISLCNFLGRCSQRTTSFIVSASANIPIVTLNSQNLVQIFRFLLPLLLLLLNEI
jgi:hypothetical protein